MIESFWRRMVHFELLVSLFGFYTPAHQGAGTRLLHKGLAHLAGDALGLAAPSEHGLVNVFLRVQGGKPAAERLVDGEIKPFFRCFR